MTTFTVVLDTVYPSLTNERINTIYRVGTAPTFEVRGGTVNVYFSNEDAQPLKAAMTLDSRSPLAEDLHTLNGRVKWILFELAGSSPVVKTNDIISGQ